MVTRDIETRISKLEKRVFYKPFKIEIVSKTNKSIKFYTQQWYGPYTHIIRLWITDHHHECTTAERRLKSFENKIWWNGKYGHGCCEDSPLVAREFRTRETKNGDSHCGFVKSQNGWGMCEDAALEISTGPKAGRKEYHGHDLWIDEKDLRVRQ